MNIYANKRRKILILIMLTLVTAVVSTLIGNFGLTVGQVWNQVADFFTGSLDKESTEYAVLFLIRLPRIFAVILIGAGMSVSGAAYQAMFNNPMVSTNILGASQAAGLGAAFGILSYFSAWGVTATAFVLSIVGVLITYFLSTRFKTSDILSLVLAGILMSSLFQSGISYLKLVADSENMLPQITYWLMGSFASVRTSDMVFLLITVGIPLVLLVLLRWRINLFTISDDEAKAMGVNLKYLRVLVIILTSIITAGSVSVVGIVGWVGLVVPHISRWIVGDDNRFMVPVSVFVGASFMLVCDTIARSLSSLEVPIGIVTSLVGVPFFVLLLMSRRKYD